jgi:NarL family two-component system response regulator LiaR
MPYSVLAVDDEPSIRQLIRLLIDTDERFTLFGTAHDGREALDQVEKRCPDAIVCDIRMPGMNGLEALPRLKAACPKAIVVIYSADPAARTALTLGADRVLDKSVDASDVLDVVAEMCRNKT